MPIPWKSVFQRFYFIFISFFHSIFESRLGNTEIFSWKDFAYDFFHQSRSSLLSDWQTVRSRLLILFLLISFYVLKLPFCLSFNHRDIS